MNCVPFKYVTIVKARVRHAGQMKSMFYPLEKPMPDVSPFTPDWTKLNKQAIAGHLTGIAQEIAATTPTTLDDIAASYLGQLLADLLATRIAEAKAGTMMTTGNEVDRDTDGIVLDMEAKGLAAPRPAIKLLVEILAKIVPLLL